MDLYFLSIYCLIGNPNLTHSKCDFWFLPTPLHSGKQVGEWSWQKNQAGVGVVLCEWGRESGGHCKQRHCVWEWCVARAWLGWASGSGVFPGMATSRCNQRDKGWQGAGSPWGRARWWTKYQTMAWSLIQDLEQRIRPFGKNKSKYGWCEQVQDTSGLGQDGGRRGLDFLGAWGLSKTGCAVCVKAQGKLGWADQGEWGSGSLEDVRGSYSRTMSC